MHYYFPDIRVRTLTFLRWYEVKPTFTFGRNGSDEDLRELNFTKWPTVAAQLNCPFDAYIFDGQPLQKIYRFYPDGTFRTCENREQAH